MSTATSLYATMAIDMHRRRIRLHRNILCHFENIKYIQFLVNVESRQFAIRFLDYEASGDQTFKVNPRVIGNGSSYEISCSPFIDRLAEIVNLKRGLVYRYTGVVVPASSMVVFNLNLRVISSKTGADE
ncbi:MAG: hypothetical protein IJX19_02705 [Clostridia bacterium]|nr:hypothetical protein [Clostridia bacterium]